MLLSQHWGGSNADRQGHEASEPQKDTDLWTYYGRGTGAGSADGSLAYDPTTSVLYTSGSGIGRLTPLVHQFGSTDGTGFASGAWTSDEGGAQFVLAGDPESEEGVRRTLSYEEAYDIWPMEQEEYERQEREGLWDVTDPPKPKDEFASIPTDENGNYSWKTIQDFKDFIGRTVQLGKDFAWHMAEWFGPDEIARAAKPLVAGGKTLAVIGFGAGKADDVDDVARAARNGKLPR
jgi:hypothetical protein